MSLPKTPRLAVYLLLAIVSIAIGIFGARYFLAKKSTPRSQIVGSRFPQDLDWQKSNNTLVLILQDGCRYCAESSEFYRRLVSKSAERHVRLIAILPDEVGQAQRYLNEAKINISEVKQARLESLGIKGTPTLLLVDNYGTIKKAWVGKLSRDKEQEVLDLLGPNSDVRLTATLPDLQ